MAEKDEHQHDNEDHKRTNGEDPSKPWETLFDDDRDDQGNLSRVATKKKARKFKIDLDFSDLVNSCGFGTNYLCQNFW